MHKSLEEILAGVFGVKPEKITDQTSPDNLSSWDSFNGLKLWETLEREYGLKIVIEEMAKVKNVGDIKNLLKKHGRL